ncbi:MAG TPA: asparagine synthase-related protein [Gemmatimonadaceae bacterium]|jgi:asparagine synthase (glutamine-hydrolysing)|nr:asparagine synthase-related protein [Gemmatimonadaceae bacterium]
MKFFAAILDTAGQGIGDDLRRRMQSMAISRLLTYRWDNFDAAAVLTGWDEFGGETSSERHQDWLIVGQARLDNRLDVERRAREIGSWSEGESDLKLVLRLVARSGPAVIPALLGDFGFIAWHAASRTGVGASDAFGLAQLYYAQHRGLTLVGSRAEPLSMTNTYDIACLGDMLTVDSSTRDCTVYAGVHPVRAASTLTLREGRISTSVYWSAANVEPNRTATLSEAEAIETCRDLLTTSIRLRLDPDGRTWSQLSGGIDSSAVVSVAQWLAERGEVPHGLDGTVTFVLGSQTGSDERSFSDEIVKRWGVRNEVVVDAPMWFDETDDAVPLLDQPLLTIIHAPIDGRFRAILRAARARVLLTGWGSDQLFTGSLIYLADHLARGRVFEVMGELAHRAALRRGSFWKLAYASVAKPFVPVSLRRLGRSPLAALPPWLRKDTLRRAGVTGKTPDADSAGRFGHKYDHWHASGIIGTQRGDETKALGEVVSLRHPFLYRPLVEFALRLPPEFCSRPGATKWVLREAMKGILPDLVRTRIGKGGGGDSLARMFIDQAPFLRQLARDPILADLGLVDGRRLMAEVENASSPQAWRDVDQGEVVRTLAIEAWLQMRSGRWPRGFAMPKATVVPRQDTYQLTVTQRRSV